MKIHSALLSLATFLSLTAFSADKIPGGQPEEFHGTKDGSGGKTLKSTRVTQKDILEETIQSKADILQGISEGLHSVQARNKQREKANANYAPGDHRRESSKEEDAYFLKHGDRFRDTVENLIILALTKEPCPNSDGHPEDGSSDTGLPGEICISLFTMEKKLSKDNFRSQVRNVILHEAAHKVAGKSEDMAEHMEIYSGGPDFTTDLKEFVTKSIPILGQYLDNLRKDLRAKDRYGEHGLHTSARGIFIHLNDPRRIFSEVENPAFPHWRRSSFFPFRLEELRNQALDIATGIRAKACIEAKELHPSETSLLSPQRDVQAKCKITYQKLLDEKKVEPIKSNADYEREFKKLEKLVAELKTEGERLLAQKFTVKVRPRFKAEENDASKNELGTEGSAE